MANGDVGEASPEAFHQSDPRRVALEIGLALSAYSQSSEIITFAIGGLCNVLRVQSVAVLLFDPSGDELYFPYIAEPDPIVANRLAGIRFSTDRGIAGWVFRHREAVSINDVANDERFLGAVDQLTGRTTRALLCAPLLWQDRTIGVIEAVNPTDRSGFTDDDLLLLQLLADQLAAAIGRVGDCPAVPTPPAETGLANVFRREGDYWTISFESKTFRVKHCKGLSHIAHLLRHPNREFHSGELVTLGLETSAQTIGQLFADADPILDTRARREYGLRLEELQEELEEARRCNDLGRIDVLQNELDVLTDELRRVTGLAGGRRAASPAERARVSVTRAIGLAVKNIAAYDQRLATHLARAIRTGTFCSYLSTTCSHDWHL